MNFHHSSSPESQEKQPSTSTEPSTQPNPAYGGLEYARQRQAHTQQSGDDHTYETIPLDQPPSATHSETTGTIQTGRRRKRSLLQTFGKYSNYETLEQSGTPPPERKEFKPITESQDQDPESAPAAPRQPRRSWLTRFSSQSKYETLSESGTPDSTPPVPLKRSTGAAISELSTVPDKDIAEGTEPPTQQGDWGKENIILKTYCSCCAQFVVFLHQVGIVL